MQKLILASSSKSRHALLQRLGVAFETYHPDVDETPLSGETVSVLVKRLSIAKAQAGAGHAPGAWIIGSDQMAAIGESLLGKPGKAAAAEAQLSLCSGKIVEFHTGVCLLDAKTRIYDYAVTITTVRFRRLSSQEISRYVEREKPFDCAGSFRSEALGISLFEQITSDDPTALLGLPLIQLSSLLRKGGLDLIRNYELGITNYFY